jgi:hypothetical protein
MKILLSALALSVGLAVAGPFAAAQVTSPTVTITQQGTGNTAAAEQYDFDPGAIPFIHINQTGTGNHVGGPGGTTAGVIQHGSITGAEATVTQSGTGNNAGIVQADIGPHIPTVSITQTGNANSAMVRQETSNGTDVIVNQNGTGNAADITQSAGDTEIRVTQTGTNNSATIVDQGTGLFSGPSVVQNGEGNTVSATALNNGLSDHTITQTGLRNHAVTNQYDVSMSTLSIVQAGADNQAGITQTGVNQSATINQNGSGNLASLTQNGVNEILVGNTALITQVGNNNNAILRQVGDGFASTINQIGSGNYANVYQH